MSISVFEIGDSRMFTFVSSVAPDSAPTFKVTGIVGTVIASITATQSDSTNFYTMYTMPTSQGFYIGEWFAQKTVIGSTFDFVSRFVFRIDNTRIP